jgi:DNA-directed RNA polymerase III subunit RPC4
VITLKECTQLALTSFADRKNNNRNASNFGSGSGSRAQYVKDEGGGGGGGGGGSGSGYRSSGGPSVKREGGGFESSEDEEDTEFPRKDIDLIEISSDEGEAAPTTRPQRSTLPVRIGRKEHQERAFGINTDASNETSAKILEEADATGQAPTVGVLKQPPGKAKAKAKEPAATSSKKPFKGVWHDTSPIKTEENSEDEQMGDAEQIGIVDTPEQPTDFQEPPPDAEVGQKAKVKGVVEPVLQTDEDRAEWTRFQSNLSHIRAELGPDPTAAVDKSGDVNMAEPTENAKKATVRDNNVYLFQIPPLMPELISPSIKNEPTDDPGPVGAGNPDVKIKVEEGFSDANTKAPEAPRFASGCVGKLRVRQSGRTTFDWGGTSYELTPGNKASFLQEVVSMNVVPERMRVVPEDAGEAVSFGRVKGKFVVVPDWNDMLG